MFGDKDGAALATSGSVLKTWISTDGKKITDFTINGQTITAPTDITYYDAEGKVIPSESASSATNIAYATGTVVTKDSALGDILSTTLFLMTVDEGKEFIKDYDVEAIWVTNDDTIIRSEGFSAYE